MDNNTSPIIRKYIARIIMQDEIIGIVLTGSYGRGDNDIYSDIDNVVIVAKDNRRIRRGKFIFGGQLFDTRVSTYSSLLKKPWSDDMFYAYLNSKVEHDPNGRIANLIKAKQTEWNNGIDEKIAVNFTKLSVIYEFKDDWRKLKAKSHFNKYVSRGDYVSAHRAINAGLELIIDLLFLLEGKTIPEQLSKITYLDKLPGASLYTKKLISEGLIISRFDLSDVQKRYEIIDHLTQQLKDIADNSKVNLSEDLYSIYLKARDH